MSVRRYTAARSRLDRIEQALAATDNMAALDAALRVVVSCGSEPLTSAELHRYANLDVGPRDGSLFVTLRDECRRWLGLDDE